MMYLSISTAEAYALEARMEVIYHEIAWSKGSKFIVTASVLKQV